VPSNGISVLSVSLASAFTLVVNGLPNESIASGGPIFIIGGILYFLVKSKLTV